MWRVKSSTTASLTAWPARLVPPPRGRTGISRSAQYAITAATSAVVRGKTTPIGVRS